MSFQPFRVRVPATTANLGAGFDCLGLALSLHNELEVSPSGLTKLGIEGEGAGQLPTDDANLVLKTIRKVSALIGRELPEIRVLCRNRIPLARGMGSSAAVTWARPRLTPMAECGCPLSPAPSAMPRVPKKMK